jgi:flagellum-specific peptidoglycan hydrolase FlgJ
MTPEQKQFLQNAAGEARKAGHVFPEMAACEAALESGFGASELARVDHNLFGTKQHKHPVYSTHNLPTTEFLTLPQGGEWITVNAAWVSYPDEASCFADRMSTLTRLAPVLPHYAAALGAASPEIYVMEVSRTWATDPKRGAKVLVIYDECSGDWNANA